MYTIPEIANQLATIASDYAEDFDLHAAAMDITDRFYTPAGPGTYELADEDGLTEWVQSGALEAYTS